MRSGTNEQHRFEPTRRQFLSLSAAAGAGLWLAGCGGNGGSASPSSGTLPWLTWDDHYVPGQIEAVAQKTKVDAKPTLIDDNAPTFLKVKQTGGQFAVASADALWLPKYFQEGLTTAIDLSAIDVSKELYSVARDYPVWKTGSSGSMGFPFAWSTKPIYYNPKYVSPKPDSYEALLSPKYKQRIISEGDVGGVFAIAGLAVGAKEPFNMTGAELTQAKDFLRELKPNIFKFTSQATEVTRALANESAWIGLGNLGLDLEVKDISGLTIDHVIPREGTYGFVDAEQVITKSGSVPTFERWINESYRAEWIAENFLKNGRPLFNEKAYKLLVDQGHQERADRLFYNEPQRAFEQTLVGPAENQQAYTDGFNEIFGG